MLVTLTLPKLRLGPFPLPLGEGEAAFRRDV